MRLYDIGIKYFWCVQEIQVNNHNLLKASKENEQNNLIFPYNVMFS